jgi:fructose-1,6-bisphosphatase I
MLFVFVIFSRLTVFYYFDRYGSATMMVLVVKGFAPNAFTLDPSTGEFVLTHADIKMPVKKQIYSVNEGNYRHWYEPVQKYVNDLKTESYSARYVGSMVADVHRTLIYGGIFLYPADKSSKQGKLRLLYEANPMSMIIEAAGGLASDGNVRILAIEPKTIHDRTGVVMGSKEEVERFLKYTGGKAN